MTEEENKAIEKIKELEKLTREESKERNLKETQKLYKEYADYYLIILNLIEKLQKENEEKDKIIFQVRDYVEPLMTEYEDGDYSIKEYCKSYIVNELLKGIFNKQYIYKGILREIITKPTIITDNDDYISVGKIIELLEEE